MNAGDKVISTECHTWEKDCEALAKWHEPFKLGPIVHNDHRLCCDRFAARYGYLWFMGKDKKTASFIPAGEP
jgi:hypothetical protein